MRFTLLDVQAGQELLSSSNIIVMVVVALFAIAAITGVFIWRKNKNKKQ